MQVLRKVISSSFPFSCHAISNILAGTFRVLIATDVAARGLDITGVSLVIQSEPPQSYEAYVHRSGRTGRANTKGVSVLFYTAKQRWYVEQIERNASIKFRRVGPPDTAQLVKVIILRVFLRF